MTVWVFGASYANDFGFNDQWMHKVATSLNTTVNSFGLNGSSLDYTYNKFNSVRDYIKENDVVIITLTTHVKRWFFRYYPEHTISPDPSNKGRTYNYIVVSPTGNPKETDALNLYYEYLNNGEIYEDYSINFFYNLNYLAKQKNAHVIVLVSYFDTERWIKDKKELFPRIHFSVDKLLDITMNEFTKEYIINMDSTITDKRVNHLIKSNHAILANKIVDNIKNKTPIDLTKGFIKHIVDNNSLSDEKFINNELFGGIVFKK